MKLRTISILLLSICSLLHAHERIESPSGYFHDPLLFIIQDKGTHWIDVSYNLKHNPDVKILKMDPDYRYIEFEYKNGLDWIAGSPEGGFITTIWFKDYKIDFIKMFTVNRYADSKACAENAKKYFTAYYGLEPEEQHRSYKPGGAETYSWIWSLGYFKVTVVIQDWNDKWLGDFEIYVKRI